MRLGNWLPVTSTSLVRLGTSVVFGAGLVVGVAADRVAGDLAAGAVFRLGAGRAGGAALDTVDPLDGGVGVRSVMGHSPASH
jgi:hypothetical protein